MKDKHLLPIIIILLLLGNLLSGCATLDGTYDTQISTNDPDLKELLQHSVITMTFVDSLDLATISVKYKDIYILPDSIRFIRVGTLAYDFKIKNKSYRWNYENGHWYTDLDSCKILLTKR